MSDEYAGKVEQEKVEPVASPQGRSVTLSITLHPNGQIEFTLPVDKVLAHGLLGAAQEHLAMQETLGRLQQMAQAGNGGGIAGLLKKMGRG